MSAAMAEIDLKYIFRDQSRHGQTRTYVRVSGKKKRLRAPEGSVEFLQEYSAALEELRCEKPEKPAGLEKVRQNTLEWLGEEYMRSVEFRRLDAKSQRVRRSILEGCFAEPRKPGAPERIGQCPLAQLEAKHVRVLRDLKAIATPGAANNRIKYLSAMFTWAVENNHLKANVARDVKPVHYNSDGFHAWEPEEVAQFEAYWPVGSKQRLALALFLFTGARRGDVVQFGRQHIRPTEIEDEDGNRVTEDWLKFTPKKTAKSSGVTLELPVLDELAAVIEATKTGHLTFLTTDKGKPFTSNGFGNWWREQCDAAGLPQCAAHGLRKAGATIAANRGATTKQLMAIYGWSDPKMAEIYVKKADQKRLAGNARKLLARGEKQNKV
ncbi:tyrosine-type recombinase/integrase [Rhodoblastus sp. 17X3]|uniref:tyrosine-type recombinase/integrase n=1 Tax=Rhodoblastus sp. 17X3 TaxID=3047026 RepID=UPI0024B6FBC5|nr:tyrosine-type recombinase/integrase [Rhodoblastus sp. 17X3]MDI9847323.1 tyrosine-type recombinase/integrase [Rhodoblastus sp. 17X3]